VGDVSYTLSKYEIVVLDMEEPVGERNITLALQRYWAQVHSPDLWDIITIPFAGFGYTLDLMLWWAKDVLIDMTVRAIELVLGTIFQWLKDLGILDFLHGIGVFVWQIIEFLIDAIEWFGYWGVKIINIMIVGTIYVAGVLTVTTLSSGAHKGFKHRSLEVFVETLEAGWEKIWSIIILILSLILFAVSIVSAVIPF